MQLLLQNKPQEVIKIVSPLGGLFCNDDLLTVHYPSYTAFFLPISSWSFCQKKQKKNLIITQLTGNVLKPLANILQVTSVECFFFQSCLHRNKSNKMNLNSSTQEMFQVVSRNSTENLNRIPHNSTNLQNSCCLKHTWCN